MSLYVHIPFCHQACTYCDFHFSVNTAKMDDMVDAIVAEIHLRKNYLPAATDKPVLETIYFGGGTPSLLSENHFEKIFSAIHEEYQIAERAEITIEANPDDLTTEKLQLLKKFSVNRLSIGVQSFFDDDLSFMNRTHNSETAIRSVELAVAAGFHNITIDLIYGLPGMDDARWKYNLDKAFSLPVQHLSCYCLTVEKKTALDKMIREGKVQTPSDAASVQQFTMLMDEAERHGFDHYEISNFGKPGFYSRHNSAYWNNTPYIGIGPSAHSYNGNSRQWNIASNAAYILAIRKGELPAEAELLTPENRYNEYIMTGLRTQWGVDINRIEKNFGAAFREDFLLQISSSLDSELVQVNGPVFTLTRKGRLLADRITAALFAV